MARFKTFITLILTELHRCLRFIRIILFLYVTVGRIAFIVSVRQT